MKKPVIALVSITVLAAVAWSSPASSRSLVARQASPTSNAVIAWNANAGDAALAACISPGNDPLHESRLYAMMHVAIHDALNAIDRTGKPYAYHARNLAKGASPDAAVASAARNVLLPVIAELPFPPECIAAGVESVETDYDAALAAIASGPAKQRGIALGQAAAAAILQLRANDGSDQPLFVSDYPQGTEPGEYRFTPGFEELGVFLPEWGKVTPFVLKNSAQFNPGPPYAVTSAQYTADFNEVKRLGSDGVSAPSDRTPDQTQIALFWVESSPLAWNRLARTVALDRHVGLWESARLFGLLNLAMADGYIGSWFTKFQTYNYWRPVTAIQLAATDGNPDTVADDDWTPLVTTPPIPDYDSGHAVQGGAAAEALRRFFGTDHVDFTLCSRTLPVGQTCTDPAPVLRSYHSFTQAADENGLSRILVGFHFRKAVVEGIAHGRKIADRAVDRAMQPIGG
jgi:hypothetical protein